MKTLKPFKSRNEAFGKIVFDPNTFQHHLMTEEQFREFERTNQVTQFHNTPFSANPSILYSPVRAYFDLTLLCNLGCITCLNNSGHALKDELSLEQAIKVVEGLAKDFVFDVRFSGGEPTLKRGWEDIMRRAKEMGLTISLNSNGIYGPKTVDKLIGINPDEITISLDGDREHNNYIRGKGSFNRAVGSIKELHSAGCKVTINSVVTSITDESDIKKLLEIASDFCYDISFFHARPIGRAASIKDKLLTYSQVSEFMSYIERMKRDYPRLKVRTRSSSLKANSIDQNNKNKFGLMQGGTDGLTRFNVMSNGDLYAGGCALYIGSDNGGDSVLGNIVSEDYSLLNIWRNSKRLWGIREESARLERRCEGCKEHATRCPGFTLEMERYRKLNPEGNPLCVMPRGK